jgi:hypothetical protein
MLPHVKHEGSNPAPPGVEVQHIGTHLAWVEDTNVFAIHYRGDVDGPAFTSIRAWLHAQTKDARAIFVLCDVSQVGRVHASALRSMKEFEGSDVRATVVIVGASFSVRVLGDMVRRARDFFGRAASEDVRFFASEQEARTYIEKKARCVLIVTPYHARDDRRVRPASHH